MATPLHIAAEDGFSAVARVLLENGAPPDLKDGLHKTALRVAVEAGHAGVAGVLVGVAGMLVGVAGVLMGVARVLVGEAGVLVSLSLTLTLTFAGACRVSRAHFAYGRQGTPGDGG